MFSRKLLSWLPQLNHQVWILAFGRFLSQIGTGFTLFYASIFFVNKVGLSATAVGMALGSGSVAGVLGRFLGGSFVDSKFWGRRRTLLLSAGISTIADILLAFTYNLPTLVIGNLLMGLGVGLYWPATEAAVADLTVKEQRNEAFAITRLADSFGLSMGVVLGGLLIAESGSYRLLFIIDSISFLVFFAVIYLAIKETYHFQDHGRKLHQGWGIALRDRNLMVFLFVNILFTTYFAQLQSTMPLYFTNFISSAGIDKGFSPTTISAIFTWNIAFSALCQLPVARFLNQFRRTHALMLSMVFWGGGFILVWVAGVTESNALVWAILALGLLALGMVSYTSPASALVVDLAPESLRGVYLSLNSQCWAIGYFIGPTLGGWTLDQSSAIAQSFWLITAVSVIIGIFILQYLDQILHK